MIKHEAKKEKSEVGTGNVTKAAKDHERNLMANWRERMARGIKKEQQ